MVRWLVVVVVVALAALGVFALTRGDGSDAPAATVSVVRGTVIRKAVATGVVEPLQETQVNTRLAGFVRKVNVQLGQKVEVGAPLLEVWPTLTDEDLLRAERAVEAAREGREAAAEFAGGDHMLAHITRFLQGDRNLERMQKAADRGVAASEQTLRLLREGRVEVDGRVLDFVVRAPVAGHVLSLARQGDPVTPASTYGLGTVLVVLGDLDRPVFRGAVDEIDVGRLQPGMGARITLGALPDVQLTGKVTELGLRARNREGATVFDVRIEVAGRGEVPLRAGYSAVAEIELERADDVLVVPERVVAFRGAAASVLVRGADGVAQERAVETGIGDGLQVVVRGGLREGDVVVERSAARR